jgi:hypothetical protein
MYQPALTLFALGLSLGSGAALPAQGREEQERAVAAIEKAKGWAAVDAGLPGKPVTRVYLTGSPVPAAEWTHLLKAFPRLEELSAC